MPSYMSVSVGCSVLSCAWKAPRVLSGSLASITQSSSCSSSSPNPPTRIVWHRYSRKALDITICCSSELSELSCFRGTVWAFTSCLRHPTSGRLKWHCSSNSDSESFDDVSSDCSWEDLKPTIGYLPPGEVELVQKPLSLLFVLITVKNGEVESLLSSIQLKLLVYWENWNWIGNPWQPVCCMIQLRIHISLLLSGLKRTLVLPSVTL